MAMREGEMEGREMWNNFVILSDKLRCLGHGKMKKAQVTETRAVLFRCGSQNTAFKMCPCACEASKTEVL